MERDTESGLEYHAARYYMPWLGVWVSCDPIGLRGGPNLYVYCYNNCIRFNDPAGTDPPPDMITKMRIRGTVIKTSQTLHRDNQYSLLLTTIDIAKSSSAQKLYRRHDDSEWTDVTNEASGEGGLSVEWRMPTLQSDADKIRKIEGPGLMWGFALFIDRRLQGAYLKDQTRGIKNPYLRFMASAKQQTFAALGEVNQKLEEFALTSLPSEISQAAVAMKSVTMGAQSARFAQMTARSGGKQGVLGRLLSWVFGRSGSGARETAEDAARIFLSEQDAVFAVIKDGKILGMSTDTAVSHDVFVARKFGTAKLAGPLEGAEVVTIAKSPEGVIVPILSLTYHGTALPASQAAFAAVAKVFK
jgi:RHS repeat-associated protein